MQTVTISNTYVIKWMLLGYPDLRITECKKLVNIKKCIVLKKQMQGIRQGYYLLGKFTTLDEINKISVLDKENECPF